MARNYSKREPKEYNWARGFFQWLTCRVVYGTYYRIACGLKIEGRENVSKDKFFIVAANHMSAIDPFIVVDALGRNIAYMAKRELFEKPVPRFFLNLLGAFSVNREKLSVSTIKTALGIKKTNWVLGLFPQGTREADGNMDNIARGFAGLAKTLKCDILPVGITGANKKQRRPFGSHIKIKIGKPIPYRDDTHEMVNIWIKKIEELTKEEHTDENKKKKVKKDGKKVNHARKYPKDFNILTRLYQLYSLYILFIPIFSLFYRFKCSRNKNLEKKPYIFAGNHISYCDPFLMNMVTRRSLAYMAKKELYESSDYIAKNISRLGAFSVNREKLEVSTIKTCVDVFKAKFNLCIFPQGGIRKNKKIECINKGFVVIAKMVKADIVPVSLVGLEKYNWNIFKRPVVEMKMGTPISYEKDADEIIDEWRKQVASLSGYELVDIEKE